jgi:hypothetical protein
MHAYLSVSQAHRIQACNIISHSQNESVLSHILRHYVSISNKKVHHL